MTSKTITLTGSEKETFPDFPPMDDMQNWLYLYDTALVSSLAIYFGNLPHTVVASEVPVGPNLPNREDARIPDLMVAFKCDLELLKEQRGYSTESQGGPRPSCWRLRPLPPDSRTTSPSGWTTSDMALPSIGSSIRVVESTTGLR